MSVNVWTRRIVTPVLIAGAMVLPAGCNGVSVGSPQPPSISPLPMNTVTPRTPAPSTTTGPTPPPVLPLGEHWERAKLPEHAAPMDAVSGSGAWVAVGGTCAPGCGEPIAAAWTSPDGLTWTPAAVDDGSNTILTQVAWDGTAFFALGDVFSRTGNGGVVMRAGIWRSDDGSIWSHLSSIDLGTCTEDGPCPAARGFSASREGVLLIAGVRDAEPDAGGAYRSADGVTWKRIDAADAAFSSADAHPVETIAAGPGTVVVSGCHECPLTIWGSFDGSEWTKLGRIPGTDIVETAMTSDGARLVVTRGVCPVDGCTTTIWTSADGDPFTTTGPTLEIFNFPKLAFGGGSFVLAGTTPDGPQVLTSRDGLAWEVKDADLGDDPWFTLAALAGGRNAVLMVADSDATGRAIWVSRGDEAVDPASVGA